MPPIAEKRTTTPTPPLLPDPELIRARLAELAREQAVLRKVLRALVRGQIDTDQGVPNAP
jgi:hypothetical protein